ncbi:MAG: hypothetical protein LC100_06880 [Chitinophagales bacterium]|nr:hypothetical protein [Chitinophagales bacterium]
MGNNFSRFLLDKASITYQAAGTYVSLWRANGQPGQGAIPAATATCNNTTVGVIKFTQQVSPATSYIVYTDFATGNPAMTLEIHDRLAHMGGLNGTLTTAQTVSLDINTLAGTDNISERKGDADFSDISWWLEWYTATGSTAVTATVNVTYNDGTTGNLTGLSLAATRPASFMASLNALIPSASAGKFIRGVNTVTLSATTGTAGSFGVTATRLKTTVGSPIANFKVVADWAQLGLPHIPNSAALFPIVLTSTTSSGTVRGAGKIAHG